MIHTNHEPKTRDELLSSLASATSTTGVAPIHSDARVTWPGGMLFHCCPDCLAVFEMNRAIGPLAHQCPSSGRARILPMLMASLEASICRSDWEDMGLLWPPPGPHEDAGITEAGEAHREVRFQRRELEAMIIKLESGLVASVLRTLRAAVSELDASMARVRAESHAARATEAAQ